jgi:hypothetical protein
MQLKILLPARPCGRSASPSLQHPAYSLSIALLLGLLVLATSCKRASTASVASTPAEAVKTIVQRLENSEPQALWEAMPPSYQAELRELIGTFCVHMDGEVYDRAFRILKKGVRVLKEKQESFCKSPVALSMPMLENLMGSRWNSMVSLLDSIATSDAATLDSLRRMDPGRFLETTGHEVMALSDQMGRQSARSPRSNPWQKLREALDAAHVQFQPTGQNQGWLKFGSTTNTALKDVELVRVDGKWLPKSMAEAWKAQITKAREGLARLDAPESKKMKPMVSLVMGAIETALDSLLRARTQKEFDDGLKGFLTINTMVSSLRAQSQ